MKNRIRELREQLGISQVELAEKLGIHITNLNRIERGHSRLTPKRVDQITGFFNIAPADLFTASPFMVPVKGFIGAGGMVEAVDAGDMDDVEAPADAAKDTVAGIVRGDSMFPVFEDGSVLYWSRLLPPETMVNRRCVLQLADNRIYVKVLRNGSRPGLWTLQSINLAVPDIVDQIVEWAAQIEWVKPRY